MGKPSNIYYFHPDHLGTATFVSDANGEPYQFFLNLPFGELRSNREHLLKNKNNGEQTMAEQRAGSWENPFKFNGKELDQETGLYYYGARYYNPRWSSWLSVDPLADKYPHASPYNYCLNNPVIFVDPDGSAVYIINKSSKMSGTAVKNMNLYFEALYATPDGKKMLEPYVKGDSKNIYFVITDNMANDLLATYYGFEPSGRIPGADLPSGNRYSMALPYDLSNIIIEKPNSENYFVTLNSNTFSNLTSNFYDLICGASIIGHEIGAHINNVGKKNTVVGDHSQWGQRDVPMLDKRNPNDFLKPDYYIGDKSNSPAFRLNQQLLNQSQTIPQQLKTNTNRNVQKITF